VAPRRAAAFLQAARANAPMSRRGTLAVADGQG